MGNTESYFALYDPKRERWYNGSTSGGVNVRTAERMKTREDADRLRKHWKVERYSEIKLVTITVKDVS